MLDHAPLNPAAANADATLPRPEYPRPGFARADWMCLNGTWGFEVDAGNSGLERGLLDRPLAGTITVPFCPESELSGVGERDFLRAVWYRREVEVPAAWQGRRVLLHFGAVDYDATVWIDGKPVYDHRGGAVGFQVDLGGTVSAGKTFTLVVRARDPHDRPYPKGKQSDRYGPHGCHYPRTTGIWQSVWMEPVADAAFARPRVTPDLGNGAFHLTLPLNARSSAGLRVRASLGDGLATAECDVRDLAPSLTLVVPPEQVRPWSPGDPHLYGLTLELLRDGDAIDVVHSYAGLRGLTLDGKAFRINGKSVFQRLVLDQGYYPDGILTAPTDAALEADIRLSMEAGFNGARLHQKVFEERFLYHADRIGYLCWGEFPDWGSGAAVTGLPTPGPEYVAQWVECVRRDYNHPCLVGWCPTNEQWHPKTDRITDLDDVMRGMFLVAKAVDPTRPVLDSSGWVHRVYESDIYDGHDYEQDPAKLAARYARFPADGPPHWTHQSGPTFDPKVPHNDVPYRGQPYFVSEFGGVWWNPDADRAADSWGYGARPTSEEEVLGRIEGLCAALLGHPHMFGYCYTQLTDVYQEENGIYRFDRSTKLDMDRVRAAQAKKAAIED